MPAAIRLASGVFALALLLVACGGDDVPAQVEKQAADATSESGEPADEVEDGQSSEGASELRKEVQGYLNKLADARDEVEEAAAIRTLRGFLDQRRIRARERQRLHVENSQGKQLEGAAIEALAARGELPALRLSFPYLPPVTP